RHPFHPFEPALAFPARRPPRGDLVTPRYLVVTADDFGIGPATTAGILDLARDGLVTATVLLVNSPFAAESVERWRHSGRRLQLAWHPCLTLDRPVLPPEQVPSLVRPDGCFWPLGEFLLRLGLGRVRTRDVSAELGAQYQRFVELTGGPPPPVHGPHHIPLFPPMAGGIEGRPARVRPPPSLRRGGGAQRP